ncbi:Cthe_2314 family HEPN domain-containing protein [Elizabethkingia meningoseptica]
MSKTLSDHIYDGKFFKLLVNKTSKIVVKKGKIKFQGENSTITEDEKLILKMFEYLNSLQEVLQDIEKVLLFLEIDTKKIKKVFPGLQGDEEYYKYHFENYIIRIISLQDIAGKLGNILYNTNINDEKCNGYNFADTLKKLGNKNHSLMSAILERTKDIKKVRHKKLHRGEGEIAQLKGIIFWDDLEKVTNQNFDKILHQMSAEDLKAQISSIETETIEIINLINEFFDNSLDELTKL